MPKTYFIALFTAFSVTICAQSTHSPQWEHLSTKTGNLPVPNSGLEQTSATVGDLDHDGLNDFVITERTKAPAVVAYRRSGESWVRFVIEPEALHIEAGTVLMDVDGDGDLDVIAGGDWQSNQIWWWENPGGDLTGQTGWKRRVVKNSGGAKHHDEAIGDFDGDGHPELVFWNQDSHKLMMAHVPADVRAAETWPLSDVYTYSVSSQPEQTGQAAWFKGTNEHEGLAIGDVDGDGKLDIVGGGHWFRNLGDGKFEANIIEAGYTFSRAGVGHFLKGEKTEQVVLVIGDGEGPLCWYQLVKGTWVRHKIADLHFGHSLQVLDIDGDGNLDIFCGEQRLNGANPDSKVYIFYGDGAGHFTQTVAATGLDSHESKVADLNGDGKLDLLIKPYNWDTPRLDILLQK